MLHVNDWGTDRLAKHSCNYMVSLSASLNLSLYLCGRSDRPRGLVLLHTYCIEAVGCLWGSREGDGGFAPHNSKAWERMDW